MVVRQCQNWGPNDSDDDDATVWLIAHLPPLAATQSEQDATNMELHEKDNDAKCSHLTLHDKPAFSLSLQTQETKPLTNARVADSR